MDSKINVTPDGKHVDTSQVTTDAGVVHRQKFVVADALDPAQAAEVTDAAPAADAPGLVTRNIPSGVQTVEVTNFPATQEVTVTFPADQTVTFDGPQPVTVENFPPTQVIDFDGPQPVYAPDPVTVQGDDLTASVAKLTEAVTQLQEMLALQTRALRERSPAMEVPYAKNVNGVLRAVMEGGSVTTTTYFGAANVYPSWWSTGAPTSMDERQVMIERSTTNVQLARQRWSFS